jgi:lysozyme family protein
MANFTISYKKTCANEGNVLTNDPQDSGGLSYGGISKKNNPSWEGWDIIQKLGLNVGQSCPELEFAKENLYRTNYWNPIDGDNIEDQDVANQVYDMAVNAGVSVAKEILKQLS